MAKQAMLTDFHIMAFKNFQSEVANKKPLSTSNLPPAIWTNWNFLLKRHIFLQLQNFVFQATTWQGIMLFAVSKNEWINNHMKLVLNAALDTSTWSF